MRRSRLLRLLPVPASLSRTSCLYEEMRAGTHHSPGNGGQPEQSPSAKFLWRGWGRLRESHNTVPRTDTLWSCPRLNLLCPDAQQRAQMKQLKTTRATCGFKFPTLPNPRGSREGPDAMLVREGKTPNRSPLAESATSSSAGGSSCISNCSASGFR